MGVGGCDAEVRAKKKQPDIFQAAEVRPDAPVVWTCCSGRTVCSGGAGGGGFSLP